MRGPAERTKGTRPGQTPSAQPHRSDTAKAAAARPDEGTGSAAIELRDRGSDQLTTTSAPEGNGRFGLHGFGEPDPWPGQCNSLHISLG